jgi:uncharacterized membrane protein YuzA (DUF378 family)
MSFASSNILSATNLLKTLLFIVMTAFLTGLIGGLAFLPVQLVIGLFPSHSTTIYAVASVVICVLVITTALSIQFEKEKDAVQEANAKAEQAREDADLWKISLKEKHSQFASLRKAIKEYERERDQTHSWQLLSKKHPAKKAAEVIKEESSRRREAEDRFRHAQLLVEYYEDFAPYLVDLREDAGLSVEEVEYDAEYTPDERLDPVTHYLPKSEYERLSPTERSQKALDRYLLRRKTRLEIGKMYERYIGHLYEWVHGYEVNYLGITEGVYDLGRDLECLKGRERILIQCKNWSRFSTIHEKHIFQLFGSVFQYRDQHSEDHVLAKFYTTTSLSPIARRFAGELKVELYEQFKFDTSYPMIKCNINRGEKIYHLPFDQQYDKIKIEPRRGEHYVNTASEAESLGFRRAFRWTGAQGK